MRGEQAARPRAGADDDHVLVEVVERPDAAVLLDPQAPRERGARAVGVHDPRVGLEEDERVLAGRDPNRRVGLLAREQLALRVALLERLPAS